LTSRQTGLHVSCTPVGRDERLVPLIEVLRLGKKLVEFGIDSLSNLFREGLGKGIEGLTEAEQLKVESWVGWIDGMGGCEAFDGKKVLV
jgi:hypothetical protein